MRIARTLWLLSLLTSSCVHLEDANATQSSVFEYRSSAGKVATLDVSTMTLSYESGVIAFSDCSDAEHVCWQSDKAKIVVPRSCSESNSMERYISSSKELEFIGLEGLSGNVFKAFTLTGKFGYAYNLNNGLVQLILIPDSVKKNIIGDRSVMPEYTYRVPAEKAPLACN